MSTTRADGRWRGWTARVGEVLAVVAALVVGYLVIDHLDLIGNDQPPFVHSVGVGRTAHLSYADVRVTGVTTARYLVSADGTTSMPAGVYLLVSVAVRPTTEPTQINSVWLRDDRDRLFRPSVKSGCENAFSTQTGVATYAVLCFEVPVTLLDQFHVDVARGSLIYSATRNDDVADLALDISAADQRRLGDTTKAYETPASSTAPIVLTPTTVTVGS